jgi:hypothetical protein
MELGLKFSEMILTKAIVCSVLGACLSLILFARIGILNGDFWDFSGGPEVSVIRLIGFCLGFSCFGYCLYVGAELPFVRTKPAVYLGASANGQAYLTIDDQDQNNINYVTGGRINQTLKKIGMTKELIYRSDGKGIEGGPFRYPNSIFLALFCACFTYLVINFMLIMFKVIEPSPKQTGGALFANMDEFKLAVLSVLRPAQNTVLGVCAFIVVFLVVGTVLKAIRNESQRNKVTKLSRLREEFDFKNGQFVNGKIIDLKSTLVSRNRNSSFQINSSESTDYIDDGVKFGDENTLLGTSRYKNLLRYYYVIELASRGNGLPVYVNLGIAYDPEEEELTKLRSLVSSTKNYTFLINPDLSLQLHAGN